MLKNINEDSTEHIQQLWYNHCSRNNTALSPFYYIYSHYNCLLTVSIFYLSNSDPLENDLCDVNINNSTTLSLQSSENSFLSRFFFNFIFQFIDVFTIDVFSFTGRILFAQERFQSLFFLVNFVHKWQQTKNLITKNSR